MDYQVLIESIVYAVIDAVQDADEDDKDEEEEFDFDNWVKRYDVQDVVCDIVDSYACGSWRKHMQILLDSSTSPLEVDTALLDGEWQQTLAGLAVQVLHEDTWGVLRDFKERGKHFESGGVIPETTSVQLWFGARGPVFAFDRVLEAEANAKAVTRGMVFAVKMDTRITLVIRNHPTLVFEGAPFLGEIASLYDLSVGPPRWVCPRRVYCTSVASTRKHDSVQDILALALKEQWVKLVSYDRDKHQSLLPLLPP